MNKKERRERANKAYCLLSEANELLNDIIWERQEGQDDHFDKLTKLEQIRLAGCRALISSGLVQISSLQDILANLGNGK